MTKILAAVDNSPAAAPVLSVAADVARIARSSVDAVHVDEGGSRTARGMAEAAGLPLRILDGRPSPVLVGEASTPGVLARRELRVGLPADQVLSVAREQRIDMIALGWGRRLSPGRAGLVRPVLERSAIPVLLVGVLPGVRPLSPTSATAP